MEGYLKPVVPPLEHGHVTTGLVVLLQHQGLHPRPGQGGPGGKPAGSGPDDDHLPLFRVRGLGSDKRWGDDQSRQDGSENDRADQGIPAPESLAEREAERVVGFRHW